MSIGGIPISATLYTYANAAARCLEGADITLL
jgi:hypothetical protein